ncbi:phosphohistidine phosphatase SixA [bacterium]|nr:phosphohistidine phosphatase SixA [bacterium]
MNLYLVRHAQPKSENEDPRRPLSEKGRQDMQKISAFVVEHYDIHVKTILHSAKLRAQQTADILSDHLHFSPILEEVTDLKPLDDPHIWADRLSKMTEDVMFVGHLPHLGELASILLAQNAHNKIGFMAGEIVCLQRDESGCWSLCWSVKPEDVE